MKLSQFIPEIKIQPNSKIKIGGKFTLGHTDDNDNYQEFTWIISDEDGDDWLVTNEDDIYKNLVRVPKQGLIDSIKAGKTKIFEIKIQPNEKIDTNEKLLFFINKNKEEIVNKILEITIGEDADLYKEEVMDTPTILFRTNSDTNAWWQGTVKLENYYLTINKDQFEDNPILIKGVKIYFR